MGLKRVNRNMKSSALITNIDASLERLKKARALNCGADYIGIDTLVLRILPFSRPSSLY